MAFDYTEYFYCECLICDLAHSVGLCVLVLASGDDILLLAFYNTSVIFQTRFHDSIIGQRTHAVLYLARRHNC